MQFQRWALGWATILTLLWVPPARSQQELLVGVSRTSLVLPLFVADDRGFFRAAGVPVRLVDCGSGKRCLQDMLEGRLHAALAAEYPLTLAMAQKQPVVVLASVGWSTRDNQVIVRKSSGIRRIQDLAGRRVGAVAGSSAHYQLDSALLLASTDPKRIAMVDLPPPALMLALDSGRADAVCLWQPWAHQLVRQLGAEALVLQPAQPHSGYFNLATSRAVLAARRPDLERVLQGLARAMEDIVAQPAEAQAVLMRRLEVDVDYVQATWRDFSYALTLNQPLVTTLDGQRRWAMRERFLPADAEVNVLDYIDAGPLTRVSPAAVHLAR